MPRSIGHRSDCVAFALAVACGGVCSIAHADLDGDVGWANLSHIGTSDRRPLAPVGGESFEIAFQTAHYDVESARIGVDEGADGVGLVWIDAAFDRTVGPIDRWTATVPATSSDRLAYVIELTDGGDVDYLSAAGVFDELGDIPGGVGGWWSLDYTTLSHAPYGASPTASGTVFRVWAPNASSAAVRGEFNNWSATASPMTRLDEDFIAFVPGADVGDDYKFFFNGTDWRPDPRARFLDGFSSYNSRVIDPDSYDWQNASFTPAPAEEWVVYQLHVGTFAGRNDPFGATPTHSRFRDVGDRVSHLQELGVNAVMFNPFYEFPGEQSGGYNPITVYAFESTYGSPDDLKYMIDRLHGAGIAVILDTVWNHFSSSDNFLWDYDGTQIYYDSPQVNTPWGPQADLDNANVRDYFLGSVEAVMGEYRMDGYRHDAIYELVSAVQWAGGQQLVNDSMDLLRQRFPDTHVIGEVYNNSAWNTSPGGIDLDGQYHEAYKNAIYEAVEAAAFGDPDIWRLANAIDGSGPWVEGDRVFNYFELHDEAWNLSGAGRTRAVRRIDPDWPHDSRWALGRTKLANGVTILAQGMPAILMGTEWAEDAGWETEKIDWSHKETYSGVFAYYRDLIGLRTTKRALFANSPANVYHVNDGANVFAFERTGWDGRSYVVVANFSNTDFGEYIVGLPRGGAWGVIVNSEDAAYQGADFGTKPGFVTVEQESRDGFGQMVRLELPAHGLLLLQHEPEFLGVDEPCPGDTNGDGVVDGGDLLAVINNFGASVAGGDDAGDLDGSGTVDGGDLLEVVNNFGAGC